MNQKRQPDSQPARDALSSAPEPRHWRPSRWDRQTSQRWALGGVGAFGLVALFTLAGCPANLEQPQRFSDPGMVSTDPNAPPACMTQIFGKKCAGNVCHDKGSIASDLDLTSAGVTARILNVPATFFGVDMDGGTSCKPGVKLVDTSNGTASWMYTKLTDMAGVGTCGSMMPLTPPALTTDEKACVTSYFTGLGSASGGSGGTASTSGGSGGATTGGGGATTGGGAGGNGGATTGGGGGAATGGRGGSGGTSGGASGSAGTGGA